MSTQSIKYQNNPSIIFNATRRPYSSHPHSALPLPHTNIVSTCTHHQRYPFLFPFIRYYAKDAGQIKREKELKAKQSAKDENKREHKSDVRSNLDKRRKAKKDKRSKSFLIDEKETPDYARKKSSQPPIKKRLSHDGRDFQMLRMQTAKLARQETEKIAKQSGPISPLILFKLVKALEREGKNCTAIPLVSRVRGGTSLSQYAPLIIQLAEMKAIDAALQVYDTMKQENITPNAKVFKAIIIGCAEQNLKDRILSVLDEVVEYNKTRYKGDEQIEEGEEKYNSKNAADMREILYLIFQGYGKQGNLEPMAEFFERMPHYGVSPDLDCHDTVIRHLLKGDKIESATTLLQHMHQHGPPPTTKTYSMFVHWYSEKGQLDKAAELIDEMMKVGAFPNVITLNPVVFAYADKGDLDNVVVWMQKMREYNVEPDVVTYNALLTCHERRGDHASVWELFMELTKGKQMQPNRATFKLLLELCLKLKQRERGMHYIGLMEVSGLDSAQLLKDLVKKIEDLPDDFAYV